ncbi:phosphotransferase enzyme family protein [Alkalicoccobacillus plakortidis]|uniref:Phosphotransferase n=1 Tax=Alkalicoccobacillus plakortidis TaxID=444060 RepID=A0ABT0XKS8_9BACI|nr:phosphotransferase [Alkalicoccobacillus plakortidis]MCM2676315.1 phosphotransferase [Alkalicoccobacillus plakortidis]
MRLVEIQNITSSYNMKVRNVEALSERATLVSTEENEKFVLKRKQSLKTSESEYKLLKHLNRNNFRAQVPIANQSDESVVTYQNNYYVLYPYISGETFSSTESINNPIVPKLLGSTIASLHDAMSSVSYATDFPTKDLYQIVYGFALKEIEKVDDSEILLSIYQQLEREIKIISDTLPKQLIHRDAHIHNLLFKANQFRGMIDFDLVECNVRILDLCYCATSVLSEVFYQNHLREKWVRFVGELVAEYHQHNPLTPREKSSIWCVMLCIQSIFMAFFSRDQELYTMNKEMFLWIYENRSQLNTDI